MNTPNMGEQNEPNYGRTRNKNKADSVRIDTRGSAARTEATCPGASQPLLPKSGQRIALKPTTKTWGASLQHAALTLQLADAAICGLGDPESHYEDMDPLRKGIFELAVHLGAIPLPLVHTTPETSLGSLIQTNAEQAKALAQNANSIAILTCILDRQPAAMTTMPTETPSGLSESIHAPVKWSSHLKCSDNPLPIKPSPKKKASTAPPPANPSQRNHSCHLLIEFYLKVAQEDCQIGREIVSKINNALILKGAALTYSKPTPNYVYHRVKLDRVPTWVDGECTTIERVIEELTEKWAGFSMLTQCGKPSWLGHESIISNQSSASISISFASEESATLFKDQGIFYLFGTSC
ncbi:hypothetical protein BS47DRAFT_1365059 [Hydnum rufescens UP504]|uniref:Uncharacterized protein n=1 Tax=Hydnum rufescens UP504 TaxID=1448309 RepID=A0A9P6APX4_9AGAM|nr:hypothetical protein BS47DRAFT_1365059 [Hydnum rufescens UP504]